MSPLSFSKQELETAAGLVHKTVKPTPQYVWPQISEKAGCTVWVKHENHTPTGAFKVRGGITFINWLKKTHPDVKGIITATRGNHGQSQALAATHNGLSAKIYVPKGNSVEKNAAMRAFGGEVIEYGDDFDESRIEAAKIAKEQNLYMVPSFHKELVRGVATYGLELFTEASDLDTVYVPIGCGSGICSLITVRDVLGLKTKIVGVVSENADAVKQSFEQGKLIETETAKTFADGMAVRVPVKEAFDIYSKGAERIISVTDDEVANAIRIYYKDTHNLAEGAGAAPLAGLMQEKEMMQGKNVGVILCGGNIDTDWMKTVLEGGIPKI